MKGGVEVRTGAGAPTNGTSGTGAGLSGPGSLYLDYTNKTLYQNTNTKASPTWNQIGGSGAVTREDQGIPVINKSGSEIAADKLVALVGLDTTSGKPKIVLADADVAAHDDVWVTTAAIANNAEGTVSAGALSAATLNTNSISAAGDPVYLDTTAGGFAVTAPTGATARVVPVGWAVVKSATVGQILWSIGPNRAIGTNELQAKGVTPGKVALANTNILVGDAGGAAADVAMSGDATIAASGALTIGAGAVTQAKITAASLDGTVAKVVANANVIGGVTVLHQVNIADAVSGDTDVVLTHKTRVLDAWVVLTATGDAANTYTVKNAGNAITDAITPGATDTTLKRAAQINDAKHEIAAAGTLRVSHVKTGGSSAAIVYVLGIRVA